MSFDEEIAGMRARIAKAEAERERWQATGSREKYIEAYFYVNALEGELDRMRRHRFEQTAKARRSVPLDAHAAAGRPDTGERERLMAEFSITFFGQQYRYAHYRYDSFADALSYARQQLAAPSASDAADPETPARLVQAPSELERRRMNKLGITYQEGVYCLGPYRYDRLADAMGYASLGKDVRMPLASLS
jgi:hypothetical protein